MGVFKNTDGENIFNKLQLSITLVLILFLSVTGATYAYFAISVSNSTTITGEAATVNLTLDVTKFFPTTDSENTGVMVPQLSTSESNTSALASALKSGCVDGNGNIVCQVYKINIKNIGSTATLMVDGEILFYSDNKMTTDVNATMPNLRWKLITSVDAVTPSNSVLGTNADLVADANDDNIFADDVVMVVGSSFDYYIIIWINETNEEQSIDPGKSFYSKVQFTASNGTGVTSTFAP